MGININTDPKITDANIENTDTNTKNIDDNTKNTDDDTQKGIKTKQCHHFLRNGKCRNGENCTFIHDQSKHEAFKVDREEKRLLQSQRDKAQNGNGLGAQKNRAELLLNQSLNRLIAPTDKAGGVCGKSTLLRKLLENDLRRERTLTLQLLSGCSV